MDTLKNKIVALESLDKVKVSNIVTEKGTSSLGSKVSRFTGIEYGSFSESILPRWVSESARVSLKVGTALTVITFDIGDKADKKTLILQALITTERPSKQSLYKLFSNEIRNKDTKEYEILCPKPAQIISYCTQLITLYPKNFQLVEKGELA